MQSQTIRLPHSGLRVPHTGYTVTGMKQHNTHDGVAFVATLRLGGKVIGTIENGGTGGPDTFYPNTADGYREHVPALEAFAEHCRHGIYAEGNLATVPMLEFVLGDLVTEYEVSRNITKAAKRGNALLRLMEDYQKDDDQPSGTPSASIFTEAHASAAAQPDKLREQLLNSTDLRPHELAWWQMWDATTNRWLDVTDRPAHLTDEQE